MTRWPALTLLATSCFTCFVRGTRVRTSTGSRAIETLEEGDAVLTYDPDSGTLGEHTVVATMRGRATRRYRIDAGDHVIDGVTAEHPFFDPRTQTWRTASSLAPGDVVLALGPDGATRPATIRAVHSEEEPAFEVFNLTVDGPHTYFANGILVHNKSPPEPPWEPLVVDSSDTEVLPDVEPPRGPTSLRPILDTTEFALTIGLDGVEIPYHLFIYTYVDYRVRYVTELRHVEDDGSLSPVVLRTDTSYAEPDEFDLMSFSLAEGDTLLPFDGANRGYFWLRAERDWQMDSSVRWCGEIVSNLERYLSGELVDWDEASFAVVPWKNLDPNNRPSSCADL